jgi:hypothetical protein
MEDLRIIDFIYKPFCSKGFADTGEEVAGHDQMD